MNPPFGEPVPSTKAYLKAAYPWVPTKDANLFAAFVGRGVDLCRDGGYTGAITSRVGMFNTTYKAWRKEVFLGHQLTAVADLGGGVMEQAMVEAAAYVIGRKPRQADRTVPFMRLLDEHPRATALQESIVQLRQGEKDRRVYRVTLGDFDAIPGRPVAYWVHPSLRGLFNTKPSIEGTAAEVRQGAATADDFRFLRCAWEVEPHRVARARHETLGGKRWAAFAKGGEYAPYWSDVHLLFDWEDDGRRIKAHVDARYPYLKGKVEWVVKNQGYYFRPGVTWPRRTQGGFNPSILPAGCGFGDMGPGAFALSGNDPLVLLSWLNSRPAHCLLDAFASFGVYQVGMIQRLPWPDGLDDEQRREIAARSAVAASSVRSRDQVDETTRSFVAPELARGSGSLAQRLESWNAGQDSREVVAIDALDALEDDWTRALGLDAGAIEYIDGELGVPVWRLPDQAATDDQAAVLRDGVDAPAGSFTVSPVLEPAARALGLHPRRIAEARRRIQLSADVQRRAGVRLASWLVGIAAGRWDVDAPVGHEPVELLEPLPITSPAELVDASPTSMMLDEPGQDDDILRCMRAAAVPIYGDSADDIMDELSTMLRTRDLRTYMRRGFFRDHLAVYTKSRREAPLYWQLSVPSRGWGIWLYAPTLTRETLHGMVRHAERRMAIGAEESRRLRQEREAASGRSASELDHRLDVEEGLVEELRVFRDEAGRLAGLGWNPDLEDGYVLVAAMLRRLFVPRTWRKLDQLAVDIAKGSFPWASLHEWREHA
jgi:hypothetical protein